LRDAVKACGEHGVAVMCSTGRSETLDEMLASIERLWEIGITVIWVPNPNHIAFKLYRRSWSRSLRGERCRALARIHGI
jgi:hypothetical protein